VIPLRLKVFDTLLVLVENAGRLVTKQERLDAVWPETTVEENNLNLFLEELGLFLNW
jgi:DNA-binding winged helix-turn-helix (wHTH) protein